MSASVAPNSAGEAPLSAAPAPAAPSSPARPKKIKPVKDNTLAAHGDIESRVGHLLTSSDSEDDHVVPRRAVKPEKKKEENADEAAKTLKRCSVVAAGRLRLCQQLTKKEEQRTRGREVEIPTIPTSFSSILAENIASKQKITRVVTLENRRIKKCLEIYRRELNAELRGLNGNLDLPFIHTHRLITDELSNVERQLEFLSTHNRANMDSKPAVLATIGRAPQRIPALMLNNVKPEEEEKSVPIDCNKSPKSLIFEGNIPDEVPVEFFDGLPPSNGGARIFSVREGQSVRSAKMYIPEVENYNFIGRIIGPRGLSVRRIESETTCKLLIRGRGSIKDKVLEDILRNKGGVAHLNEPLHVVIACTDYDASRCQQRLKVGVEAVQALLTPTYDEFKRQQLIQLAMITGNYRP